MYSFEKLYLQLEQTEDKKFYEAEAEFFMKFYEIPASGRPDCVIAFMTISNWMGISMRDGVWTFYEGTGRRELQVTLRYLEQTGWNECREMFEYGIHDYQNPVYAKNYDYLAEWLSESERIDDWIFNHEVQIYEWERNLLVNHREEICRL